MEHTDKLRETFPDVARDIKINLGNVLTPGALNAAQVWGVALACAYGTKNRALVDALFSDAKAAGVPDETLLDAKAAAVLMAMNNVYYRFRHVIEKAEYSEKPARLRMQRMNQVASTKVDFELFCLAVSAINNCQSCIQSHEATVLEHGLTSDQVHDAVRIAAVMNAATTALECADA